VSRAICSVFSNLGDEDAAEFPDSRVMACLDLVVGESSDIEALPSTVRSRLAHAKYVQSLAWQLSLSEVGTQTVNFLDCRRIAYSDLIGSYPHIRPILLVQGCEPMEFITNNIMISQFEIGEFSMPWSWYMAQGGAICTLESLRGKISH